VNQGGYLSKSNPRIPLFNLRILSFLWVVLNILSIFVDNYIVRFSSLLIMSGLSSYFFIYLRYSGIGRGMGAPGYFTYFSNFIVLWLSLSQLSDNWKIRSIMEQSLEMLLGAIFFISGIYKLNSGFTMKNSFGINIGLCNEMWAYKPDLFVNIPPKSWLFKIAQLISTWGEIIGGLLLITGFFAKVGSLILITMFIGIGFFIRLGLLVPQLVFCLLLPFIDVSTTNYGIDNTVQFIPNTLACLLALLVVGEFMSYIFFLDQSQIYNFKGIRKLHKVARFYSRYFGTILWRVFTPDITSLHINVFTTDDEGKRTLLSKWKDWRCLRFRFVGEAVTLTSIFTTLRYYPSNQDLFEKRLLSYVNSLKCSGSKFVEFEISRVKLGKSHSELELVSRFKVDLNSKLIMETPLTLDYDLRMPEFLSKIRPDSKIGEYG